MRTHLATAVALALLIPTAFAMDVRLTIVLLVLGGLYILIGKMVPPLLVVAGLFLLWEWLCSGPGATLPPPTRVWADTKELILNPFYDRGGLDKGLQDFHGTPLALHALQRLRPQVGHVLINANRHHEAYSAFGAPVVPDASADFAGPMAGVLAPDASADFAGPMAG
eukprot:gene2459-3076_t